MTSKSEELPIKKAGYHCPTGEHVGGRCCVACDHDDEYAECLCFEIMDEMVRARAEKGEKNG
jgi:hypothetical protein